MQNPSAGSRPSGGGYWIKGIKLHNGGGKDNRDSRGMNPGWAPYGPRRHRGPPSRPRSPGPPVKGHCWQGPSTLAGPVRPWAGPTHPFVKVDAPPLTGQRFPRPFPAVRFRNPPAAKPDPSNDLTQDKKNLLPKIPPLTVDSSLPTFDLQAQAVVKQCLLSPERRKAVDMVISDVQQLLRSVLPDNVPVVYGSMATGLAWETSDIDCFIASESIPDGMERVKLLIQKYKIFYRRGTFRAVVRIPNARVPLVKAVHSRTGIEIDISCTSEAALYNTKLVEYLVQTDERIRPLIVLISLVYRLNGLSGTHRFVSYTQVLLVVFYLQNLDVPMLPPLRKIVYREGDELWPKHLTTDVHRHLQPNHSNLTSLFSGFFKFYDSFDFSTNVISTYMGHPIPVECFSVPDKLSDELAHLKSYYYEDPSRRNSFLDKFICVQDPMEHHINTTSYVQIKTVSHFKNTNSRMIDIMGNPETSWLDYMMKMAEEVPIPDLSKNVKPNPNVEFSISHPYESENQDEWLSRLKKDLMAVFKLLLFDTVEVSKEPEAKVRISEENVHNRVVMTFELHTFFNVFTKRFKDLPKAVVKNPALFQGAEKEIERISTQMKKPMSSFHCELAVKQPVSHNEVPLEIRDINSNAANTFLHLSGMLQENLTGLIASAWKSEALSNDSKEQNKSTPNPEIKVKKQRSPCTRFAVSYKKHESENEEDWKARFKTDLISLFEFLLLEHSEVTSECEKTEILDENESLLFAFRLSTMYNIFTKRFKNAYDKVIKDPSSVPSVTSEIVGLCPEVNPQTVSTFHGELIIFRSDCLSPDQVFVKVCDINLNLHNCFSHYSANLQLNFAGLLSSIKMFREMQSYSEPVTDKADNQSV